MRTLRVFASLLLLLCLSGQARELRFAEPSSGLAFSPAEVARHAQRARTGFLNDMQRKGELGCVVHCADIERVWQALLPIVLAQQPRLSASLQLVVVNNDSVNAMSFPDGTIVISERFISRLALSDAQIAFVLAHEASHVLMQHERQTLTSMLALMPAGVRRSATDVYTELEFRYFSFSEPLSLVFHQIEFEADEVGFQLAALAGFAPEAQLRFMELSASAGATASVVSVHPDMAARLGRLRQLLPLARRLFEFGRQ